MQTLKMIGDMRLQFLDLLSDIGFVDKSKGANVSIYDHAEIIPTLA